MALSPQSKKSTGKFPSGGKKSPAKPLVKKSMATKLGESYGAMKNVFKKTPSVAPSTPNKSAAKASPSVEKKTNTALKSQSNLKINTPAKTKIGNINSKTKANVSSAISTPSVANRVGAKAKQLTSSASKKLSGLKAGATKAGSKLVVGATGSKARKIGGRVGIGLAAIGAGTELYNRFKSSDKPAAKPAASKAPVQSDLAKKYNRKDEIGKPATPMVLKKPTAPAKKAVTKKPVVAKRPGQVALAKGISAKDIKLSTPATIGKPEVKSDILAKAPTTSATSESKPKYSEKRIERMENRAGRKAERMSNRAERVVKRASKLVGKLKSGGLVTGKRPTPKTPKPFSAKTIFSETPTPRKPVPTILKRKVAPSTYNPNFSRRIKAKNGKSFPDLNKDGKITKADILKGRGVIAKKGASVRKAGLGDILGKVAGSGAFGLAGMAANKLFGGKKKAAAPAMGAAPMGAPAAAPAAVPAVAPMKKGGKIAAKKKMMKSGGKAKKCKYGCK